MKGTNVQSLIDPDVTGHIDGQSMVLVFTSRPPAIFGGLCARMDGANA